MHIYPQKQEKEIWMIRNCEKCLKIKYKGQWNKDQNYNLSYVPERVIKYYTKRHPTPGHVRASICLRDSFPPMVTG